MGSTDGFFARKPALKRLALAVRRERPTGRSRRTADESRLSEGFRAKEPSVDPTRQVNMSVFCGEVFIVNWRADLRKYKNSLAENMFSNSLVRV